MNFVAGDSMPAVDFTITKGGAVVDLTSCTVAFTITNLATGLQINPANQSCNVINAASGQARWTPLAATLATPGYYEGELQVTFADSTVQTGYDVFPIVVRAKG